MEISLHLGAHKTATTYLQTRLRRNARRLAAAGVGVVPLGRLRATLTPALGPASGDGVRALMARRQLRRAARRIVAEGGGARRLLLSDENLIGGCARIVDAGAFYPGAAARLEVLAGSLDDCALTLMLALRGYAGFYASAWGQRLRAGHYRPFDAALRARFVEGTRGWPDLVAEVRGAFPGARLVLWQYEDMARVEAAILARMIGPGAPPWLAPLSRRPLTGFSARAVGAIARLADTSGHVPRGAVQALAARYPKGPGEPAFDPWSEAERAELDLRYATDVQAIRRTAGADFLG